MVYGTSEQFDRFSNWIWAFTDAKMWRRWLGTNISYPVWCVYIAQIPHQTLQSQTVIRSGNRWDFNNIETISHHAIVCRPYTIPNYTLHLILITRKLKDYLLLFASALPSSCPSSIRLCFSLCLPNFVSVVVLPFIPLKLIGVVGSNVSECSGYEVGSPLCVCWCVRVFLCACALNYIANNFKW